MIALNEMTFEFGSRVLYEEVSWHIKPKERIGLIGANGTGKSTLLKILVGEYRPNSGTVSRTKDLKIGYLNQDLLSYQSEHSILHVAMEAFERQNELHDKIQGILLQMETDYSESILEKLSVYQEEFEALDGYRIQYKAEEILAGLGFTPEQSAKPLKEFSGGWRMRVMLAKILLQQPDLLLLDEPTNHLDLPSILWLENYLNTFDGALVIVSHDRYFLDRTVQKIVESRSSNLFSYSGNYSFYLEEKAVRQEIQKGEFKNQQSKIKQEEKLIERFRAKASKAKMVQSRIKALDKLERVDDVESDAPTVSFKFRFSRPSGRSVALLEDINKSYPGLSILKSTGAEIEKGDKIALIGANGKGKSTLLRIIAGTESFEGKSQLGFNVIKTFFAQHQLEALTLENTILGELQSFAPTYSDTELRTLLGCFLFTGDDVFKKIKVLSGGEKSRVALAKTLTSDSNFLILDEPTNHLDIQSVNILIQALQQFEGTCIIVSHDRYFLSQVANRIWFIENQEIKTYPGTYDEYEIWDAERKKNKVQEPNSIPGSTKKADLVREETSKSDFSQNGEPKNNGSASPNSESKMDNALKGKQRMNDVESKKLEKRLSLLEKEILEVEKKKEEIEKSLSNPEHFKNSDKMAILNQDYREIQKHLEILNRNWEEIAEQLV